jgi:hypothetical protein
MRPCLRINATLMRLVFFLIFVHQSFLMRALFASPKSDWVGILSSLGCLIHCLALPALFYVSRLSSEAYPILHNRLLDYVFAVIATLAVFSSLRKLASLFIRGVLIGALVFFTGGILLEEYTAYATVFLHIGTFGLLTGHTLSIRQQHHPSANPSRSSANP